LVSAFSLQQTAPYPANDSEASPQLSNRAPTFPHAARPRAAVAAAARRRPQVAQAATGEAVLGAAPVWHPLDVKAFVGVSGAYDLEGLAEHLHR
jgi:hypothetical protein